MRHVYCGSHFSGQSKWNQTASMGSPSEGKTLFPSSARLVHDCSCFWWASINFSIERAFIRNGCRAQTASSVNGQVVFPLHPFTGERPYQQPKLPLPHPLLPSLIGPFGPRHSWHVSCQGARGWEVVATLFQVGIYQSWSSLVPTHNHKIQCSSFDLTSFPLYLNLHFMVRHTKFIVLHCKSKQMCLILTPNLAAYLCLAVRYWDVDMNRCPYEKMGLAKLLESTMKIPWFSWESGGPANPGPLQTLHLAILCPRETLTSPPTANEPEEREQRPGSLALLAWRDFCWESELI